MKLEELEARLERMEAILEIQNLQSRYNFYLAMYWGEKVADELYLKNDPDISADIGDKFFGMESIKRCFSQLDLVHKSQPGRMGSIMALEPLIYVGKDRKTARGQWWGLGFCSLPIKDGPGDQEKIEAVWMFGKYDNDYALENGQWKFKKIGFYTHFLSPYRLGWVNCPEPFSVRTFEAEEGSRPDIAKTSSPFRYNPEGPNSYGPPPPDPLE